MSRLTIEDARAYARDGVLLVREAVGAEWVARLRAIFESLLEAPGPWTSDTGHRGAGGRALDMRYLWPEREDVRRFVFDSGIAALAGDAMGSRDVRLYFDHWFLREPGGETGTPWHQDAVYWPFEGRQIASLWIPLTEVDAASSPLEIVKGSHAWGRRFRAARFVAADRSSDWLEASEGDALPDVEANRRAYDIFHPALQPGDGLLFSAWALHAAPANRSPRRRAALSVRFLGDDVRWQPRAGTDPTLRQEDVAVEPGALARDDEHFPLVWRRES
jgi:ectoine hydroxylase-related dioxygenase (phytanoyl-CoA dioxygenase family)